MIEKAIFFTNLNDFKKTKLAQKFRRIYFGNEFCQRLIPTKENIEYLLGGIKNKDIEFTLVTPFVTDEGLSKLKKILSFLNSKHNFIEVVINDWGVLELIKNEFLHLKPVLGRLMFRVKRDPRMLTLIKDKQKSIRFKDAQGNTVVVLPKRIPVALKEAYCKTNFDFLPIKDFLISYGIHRIEVDNLTQGLLLDLPEAIAGSIYVPFGYLSVTRYCSKIKHQQDKNRIGRCAKECQQYFFKMRSPCMPSLIYKKGNTQFYKNSVFSIRKWKKMGIDRLIYEPGLPV